MSKVLNKKNSGIGLIFVLIIIAIISIGIAVTVKNSSLFQEISGTEIAKKQLAHRALELIERAKVELQKEMGLAFKCHSASVTANLQQENPALFNECNVEGLYNQSILFSTNGISGNNPQTWANTWVFNSISDAQYINPILTRVQAPDSTLSIECKDTGGNSCNWNRQSFPKQFKVKSTVKNSAKGIVVQYTAMVELAPDSLRDMAYLVTNETQSNVTFSDGVYTGKVGVIFNQEVPGNKYITFAQTSQLDFKKVFFTNALSDNFIYKYSVPTFEKGVAPPGVNFANELHSTFEGLSNGPGVIKPSLAGSGLNPADIVFQRSEVTFGSNSDPCSVKMVYQPYTYDIDACLSYYGLPNNPSTPTICSDPTLTSILYVPIMGFVKAEAPIVFHNGPVSPNSVFFAPGSNSDIGNPISGVPIEGRAIIDTENTSAGLGTICDPNFTIVGSSDVKLRTSLQKDPSLAATQGNIAIVSLNGNNGIIIDKKTRSLIPGKTFGNIINESISVQPSDITFRMDASLVALGGTTYPGGASNPTGGSSAPYFDYDLISSPGRRLGTLSARGGMIGTRYSPSRLIDNGSGVVTSGFDKVDFQFNDGALSNPPPGFAESTTSLIGAAITSLSLTTESAEDAIAAITSSTP